MELCPRHGLSTPAVCHTSLSRRCRKRPLQRLQLWVAANSSPAKRSLFLILSPYRCILEVLQRHPSRWHTGFDCRGYMQHETNLIFHVPVGVVAQLATWLPQAAWLLSIVKPTVGNPAGSRNPNVNSCFSLVSVTLPLHFLRLLSHCWK